MNMKKIMIVLAVVVAALLVWYGESRKFFCVENGKCITLWKTFNNVCYIIPGKYYGLTRPSTNFLESTNTNNIMVFFSSGLPNAFVYKSEQPLKINNDDKRGFGFYDYNADEKRFDSLLYIPNARTVQDVKEDVQYLDISIHENYATDKNGRRM